jgi:hypothetical protein
MKYAIKVPFEDDWLYVTDADAIVTYDTFEEAQEDNNKVWSGKGTIVEYGDEEMSDYENIDLPYDLLCEVVVSVLESDRDLQEQIGDDELVAAMDMLIDFYHGGADGVRKRIKDEIEETRQDLERLK